MFFIIEALRDLARDRRLPLRLRLDRTGACGDGCAGRGRREGLACERAGLRPLRQHDAPAGLGGAGGRRPRQGAADARADRRRDEGASDKVKGKGTEMDRRSFLGLGLGVAAAAAPPVPRTPQTYMI